jgi:glycerophosphoryl diester phosphodiesterase
LITKYKIIIISFLLLLLGSCSEESIFNIPELPDNSILEGSLQIPSDIKYEMNGKYEVKVDGSIFGENVVGKWSGEYFSLFCPNYILCILKGGIQDSSFVFEGYWYSTLEAKKGLIRIYSEKKIADVFKSKGEITGLSLNGKYSNDNNDLNNNVIFSFKSSINYNDKNFRIIGHRGGGRNTDHLPAPEGSLALLKMSEQFGVNGMELDVRLTKDNIPIVYHDNNINPEVLKTDFCVGPISNYTFEQLRTLCKLKNNEPIPTLRDALDMVLENTNLSLLWLDIKSIQVISYVIPIQMEYMSKAKKMERKIEILMGLSNEEMVNTYLANPEHNLIPALCELDEDNIKKSNALIWAPRWEIGPSKDKIKELHMEGKRVFFWTLDNTKIIQYILNNYEIDGILSNYPSLVAYEYYSK